MTGSMIIDATMLLEQRNVLLSLRGSSDPSDREYAALSGLVHLCDALLDAAWDDADWVMAELINVPPEPLPDIDH